jgi:hypothetical protein
MRSTNTPGQSLSDDDLQQLLKLMSGADSVELKLTVPDESRRSAVASLAMDPLDAQIRQAFFFDTPDLALDKAGVVVRARRVQGRNADSVVKLRPVNPADLPSDLRKSPNVVVEVDAMPGGYVCSASFKGRLENDHVREAALGTRPIRKLFTKEQRGFYATHAPDGLALEDLSLLGPVFVLKLKFEPEGYGQKLVAELWLYPDGSRILELSTKSAPGEAFQVAAESRAYLTEQGIDLSGEQQTKTKAALEFFAAELRAETAAGSAPSS